MKECQNFITKVTDPIKRNIPVRKFTLTQKHQDKDVF